MATPPVKTVLLPLGVGFDESLSAYDNPGYLPTVLKVAAIFIGFGALATAIFFSLGIGICLLPLVISLIAGSKKIKESRQTLLLDNLLKEVRDDLLRHHVIVINGEEFGLDAQSKGNEAEKLRLIKLAGDERAQCSEAVRAKKHLKGLGLSERSIFILFSNAMQGMISPLSLEAERRAAQVDQQQPGLYIVRADTQFTKRYNMEVSADKTATISSAATLKIIEGEYKSPKTLESRKVDLVFDLASCSLRATFTPT
jgi:hypothetical protein